MRLIDADALMQKICENECGSVCDEECENVWCSFYDYIMDEPTIEPEPAQIRLGSEANGCWIKCKDCENTRCSRRVVEDPPDPSVYDDSHLDQIVDDMLQ